MTSLPLIHWVVRYSMDLTCFVYHAPISCARVWHRCKSQEIHNPACTVCFSFFPYVRMSIFGGFVLGLGVRDVSFSHRGVFLKKRLKPYAAQW